MRNDISVTAYKRIHWLTFLNNNALRYVGDRINLQRLIIQCKELRLIDQLYGFCVQAGDNPQIDKKQLSAYFNANKILKPMQFLYPDDKQYSFHRNKELKKWMEFFNR